VVYFQASPPQNQWTSYVVGEAAGRRCSPSGSGGVCGLRMTSGLSPRGAAVPRKAARAAGSFSTSCLMAAGPPCCTKALMLPRLCTASLSRAFPASRAACRTRSLAGTCLELIYQGKQSEDFAGSK